MDRRTNFTPRAVAAGLLVGILINVSNMYYGLQSGYSNQMPILSALLSFILFRALRINFTAAESVLTTSVATATGCMPVTAGLTGVIPAIEYVLEEKDGGRSQIDMYNLIIWSCGVAGFGLLFASLLWRHFIVHEDLPWPGPKATASMIRTLYGPSKLDRTVQRDRDELDTSSDEIRAGHPNEVDRGDPGKSKLLLAGVISGLLTILTYFVPHLRQLPLFGNKAATDYLWTVNVSPGFFGQGIITGPVIPLHMLLGAVTGWAILAPMAKQRGWAQGNIEDWESGGRGWIIWIAVAGLMADALVKLTWFITKPMWNFARAQYAISKLPPRGQSMNPDMAPLLENDDQDGYETSFHTSVSSSMSPMQPRTLMIGFVSATLLCVATVHVSFGSVIPWYNTLFAVALALPMAVVGIRSLAEADFNPESALFSQSVFAAITPSSNPNAMVMNILSAGLAQAGASQSGDVAFDFKIGYLIGAPAGAQLLGQLIGSAFGAVISSFAYRLYTSHYSVPGTTFQIPAAYLDVTIAKLVMGRGLPVGVTPFVVGFGVFFILATILKMKFANSWWQSLIPSGISFAIGMYNTPSFTLARVVGGLFYWFCISKRSTQREGLVILASGLIMGESLASLVGLGLATLNAPQIGNPSLLKAAAQPI